MKTKIVLVAAVCLGRLALAQPSNQSTMPGPEFQKLAMWHGEWAYQIIGLKTQVGPAYTATGKMIGRALQNGFVCECVFAEKGSSGETQGVELIWYDTAAKRYAFFYLRGDGSIEQGPLVLTANGASREANGSCDGRWPGPAPAGCSS
jgi:hypothetical protein